jgi:hypothetical protein
MAKALTRPEITGSPAAVQGRGVLRASGHVAPAPGHPLGSAGWPGRSVVLWERCCEDSGGNRLALKNQARMPICHNDAPGSGSATQPCRRRAGRKIATGGLHGTRPPGALDLGKWLYKLPPGWQGDDLKPGRPPGRGKRLSLVMAITRVFHYREAWGALLGLWQHSGFFCKTDLRF